MKGLYRFVRVVAYLPLKIFFPTKVLKIDRLPASKCVTVSNHLTGLDVPLIWINVKGMRHYVAKKEIGKNRLIGYLAKKAGVVFVDRGKADMKFIRTAVGLLKEGEVISLFPEGTRNRHDETLQEIKSGAALLSLKGDAPIVPIMIYHREKVFRKNYIFIGEPFELDEFKGQLMDTEALARAADVIAAHMTATVEEMARYVEGKQWKQDAKAKRQRKKNERLYKKQSKAAAKNLRKALRGGTLV